MIKQRDVNQMGKNALRLEVLRLRGELESQRQTGITSAENVMQQVANGWNGAMKSVVKPMEELHTGHNNIDVLIEKLCAYIALAAQQNRLRHDTVIEYLKTWSGSLREWLSYIDPFNRELGAIVQKLIDPTAPPYYIDVSYAQRLYNATQNFVNRLEGAEHELLALLHENPDTHRTAEIAKAFKQRDRKTEVDYDQIVDWVDELRQKDNGRGKKNSVDEAATILQHDSDLQLGADTIARYYHRGKKLRRERHPQKADS